MRSSSSRATASPSSSLPGLPGRNSKSSRNSAKPARGRPAASAQPACDRLRCREAVPGPHFMASPRSDRTAMELSEQQFQRYARHLILDEVGEEGQEKLLPSRVLVVGAGGLGSPPPPPPPPPPPR